MNNTMRVLAIVLAILQCESYAPKVEKGLLLPGGGLFFWWQLGALERVAMEGQLPPLTGASAGALAAVCAAGGVKSEDARRLAIELSESAGVWDRGRFGLAGIWGPMIRAWLEELLPENAAEINRKTRIFLLARRRFGYERILASDFVSKNDVIDAALASAHVPLFLDGRLEASWRHHRCIDGSVFLSKSRHLATSCQGYVTLHHSLERSLEQDVFTQQTTETTASSRSTRRRLFLRKKQRAHSPRPRRKDEAAFALPSHVLDSPSADIWLTELSARGYQWADKQLSGEAASLHSHCDQQGHQAPLARLLASTHEQVK